MKKSPPTSICLKTQKLFIKISTIIIAILFGIAYMLTPKYVNTDMHTIALVRFPIGVGLFLFGILLCTGFINWIRDKMPSVGFNISNKLFGYVSFFLILLVGIFYLSIYYPGVGMYDSVAIVKSGVGMAKQHPWFYCLLIEKLTDIVYPFGGYEAVFVAESIIQILLAASVTTHCLIWLKRKGINCFVLSILLAIYAFCPIFDLYMVTLFKDVPISYIYMEWLILLYDCHESCGQILNDRKIIIRLSLLLIFSLLRNNGIYVSSFILICLFLFYKQRKAIVRFSIILIFVVVASNIYESKNNITHLFKETAGIPLQQIAAVVCDENGKIDEVQEDFIGKIIPLDFIREHYDSYTADKLKWGGSPIDDNFFNTHKAEFLKVWAQLCIPNFKIYVEAYIRATYGFWSTGDNAKGRYPTIYVPALDDFFVENNINIKNILPNNLQDILERLTWESSGYFWGEGHLFWILLFVASLLVLQRGMSVLTACLPCFGGWLTIMLSTPVAYSWRYIYYIPLSIPILIGILFLPSKDYKEPPTITVAESSQEESFNDE